ncbi:uncharacterized protein EV420DRAFT_1514318 [Desarmillaria tabescens]|uniref:Uncharacterized protein n=1 Tax=Armillaria tabescens TaxID=1929756 RepID=A0AA39NGX4_ARMTA|nr:uncharacterized protein EV420DRAFT_1514318 [Desarmillaria tabescens]KAK0465429.1 hypothetical protein EV420DRAFT_1514318 [Desarmillaria tabescens]
MIPPNPCVSSRHESAPAPTLAPSQSHTLLPRVTSSSTCCTPNEVVIALTTTLAIPDYTRYYDVPIAQFTPSYRVLDDGSLVAPPLMDDLRFDAARTLVAGMLTTLFTRNLFVSGDYIRRAKVKSKILFYTLFASQLFGAFALIPIIIPEFDLTFDCTLSLIITDVLFGISLTLLFCILGYKAYKCLNNSRFVGAVLLCFLASTTTTTLVDAVNIKGERNLLGSCHLSSDLRLVRTYLLLQLSEVLFICACFLWAVWKSRSSPLARGRISIRLSMDDCAESETFNPETARRGWWDYVPKKEAPVSSPVTGHNNFIRSLYNKLISIPSDSKPPRLPFPAQKTPIPSDSPIPQPPRPSVAAISEALPERPSDEPSERFSRRSSDRLSPVPSSYSRLSRYMPRMELFREVMKDELCYTTVITAVCVVAAVLAVISTNVVNDPTMIVCIPISWAVISLLTIHSFGRVVRRHEKDALIQNPRTWPWKNPGDGNRPGAVRRQSSPQMSYTSHRRTRRFADSDDQGSPYSETRGLNQSRSSWNSGFTISSVASLPSPPVLVQSFYRETPQKSSVTLPSPTIGDFLTSGRTTPVVSYESSDALAIKLS